LSDDDRELFLSVLSHVVDRFGWICHAYCLMSRYIVRNPVAAGMAYNVACLAWRLLCENHRGSLDWSGTKSFRLPRL